MKQITTFLVLGVILSLAPAVFADGKESDEKAHAAKVAEMKSHGWLGIETQRDEAGIWTVASVASGSPAERAGFHTSDVLVSLNGLTLQGASREALQKAKNQLSVGKPVTYIIERGGKKQTLTATLAPVPDAVLAKWMAQDGGQETGGAKMAKKN